MLSGKRTLQSQLLAIIEPKPRNRNHENTQKSQQTASPFVSQPVVHLRCEKWEASSDEVANQNNAGKCRGTVSLVTVDDVVEDGEDDDVDAEAEEAGSDDGHDPVDGGEASPGKPLKSQFG